MFDKKILVLCADDFGLSAGIDAAILDLVRAGRLSAVSCMVGGADFAAAAPALVAAAAEPASPVAGAVPMPRAEIGLHLTLTDLAPLGAMPKTAPDGRPPTIGALIHRSYTGRLVPAEIAAEVRRQIARFREVVGRGPDFLDGHQHCHVLPAVRRAVLDEVRAGAFDGPGFWIRSCEEPIGAIRHRRIEVAKAGFIALLSKGLAASARRSGARTNDSFRGVTNFRADPPFREAFRTFLTGPGRHPLVMCHPGFDGWPPDPTDAIMPARLREAAYLTGADLPADLDAAGVRIGTMAASFAAAHPHGAVSGSGRAGG